MEDSAAPRAHRAGPPVGPAYTDEVITQSLAAGSWSERAARPLVYLLPVLATVALYLPSGLLMPVRLVTLVLAAAAVWNLATTRTVVAPRVMWAVVVVSASFITFGAIGMLRYPQLTSLVDVAHVGFIIVTCVAMALLTIDRSVVIAGLWGWASAGVLAAAVGLWEITTGDHLPGNLPSQQFSDTIAGWNVISSFFDNPNLYAYQLVVLILLLPVLWYVPGRGTRWLSVGLGILGVYLLLWTEARIALLTLLIGAGVWCLRYRWTRIAALVALALTGATMALGLRPGSSVVAFTKLALDNIQWRGTSTWVRAEMARSGWWMTQQSDYLGVGPGGYARWAFLPENPHTYEKLNNAHWGMVEVMAEYGVITVALLLLVLAAGTLHALRTERKLTSQGGQHLNRAILYAGAVQAITLPLLCVSNSTWLRQPLTAVHLGLIVSLIAYAEVVLPRACLLNADTFIAMESQSETHP